MNFWFKNVSNRRDENNRDNSINIGNLNPKFSHSEFSTNNDDLILSTGPLHIKKDASGDWDYSAVFMSRTELTELIDFLVQNPQTFPEIADKVLARLRDLVAQEQ